MFFGRESQKKSLLNMMKQEQQKGFVVKKQRIEF